MNRENKHYTLYIKVKMSDLCLRNKTSLSVFYRGNKIWVQVWVLMNEITSMTITGQF